MIHVNELIQKGRPIFRTELYNQFCSHKDHFRLILTIEERKTNNNSNDKNLVIDHQLWQSIDDPWIFVIFMDLERLQNSIESYIASEFTGKKLVEYPTIPNTIETLKEVQEDSFQFIIEIDPLIFDQSTQMSPSLVDIDFFNNFYDFKQIIPLETTIFQKPSSFYYKGIEQDKDKVPRLFFYALHHPYQFVKESIAEAFDHLYKVKAK